ncbi:MAG TPA: sigma-70 family RNA polymerase sigma factor [Thermoanaerobaculia bacterium]|nr:sigma-70 family RNA polymerase sigma factor [Thermoanaerobaculia bacterium]
MDPRELLESSLEVIDRIVAAACRRARRYGPDAEDFAATVRLALIEDDYAVLRKYQGRSAFSTYLTVVIERMMDDDRNRILGRWRPSAEALRLGAAAVLLESLVRRDGRPLDEVLPLVQAVDRLLTREGVEAMLRQIPERSARTQLTPLEDVAAVVRTSDETDALALSNESRKMSERTNDVVRATLAALPAEDRALLQMRFAESMKIADISRMLRLPQRPLYRRIEGLLERFRASLAAAGVEGSAAANLLQKTSVDALDFGFEERMDARQSNQEEGPDRAAESW